MGFAHSFFLGGGGLHPFFRGGGFCEVLTRIEPSLEFCTLLREGGVGGGRGQILF